jgi:hypothetical protein
MAKQINKSRTCYEHSKLLEAMSATGPDYRPERSEEANEEFLKLLWKEHPDKMPKFARLRWEADHDS